MQTYFHVARDTYTDGDDLLSWQDYIDRFGEEPGAWKWGEENEGLDVDIVSLFSDRDEANEYMADFGGVLLQVEFPEWAAEEGTRVITNSEGYAAVISHIPAAFVSRA